MAEPITILTPAALSPRDPGLDAAEKRRRQEFRAAWQSCAKQVGKARTLLQQIEQELLPQMEAAVAEADRALDAARSACFVKKAREQGNQVVGVQDGPRVLGAMFWDHGELESDPAYYAAMHQRLQVIQGRSRLWDWRRWAQEVVAVVEHCEPPPPE